MMYAYADQLWQDVPAAQFYKGSAMLELVDFLERLAPFSEPSLLIKEEQPYMSPRIEMQFKQAEAVKPVSKYFQ